MDAAGTTKPREPGQANFDTVSVMQASLEHRGRYLISQSLLKNNEFLDTH